MNPPRPRRLAFELLEPKTSPTSLLLALAPLGEPDPRFVASEVAMYAPATTAAGGNAELLQFIERHTHIDPAGRAEMPLPTREQAAAADKMMQATDTELRSMLRESSREASSADFASVYSVIQF